MTVCVWSIFRAELPVVKAAFHKFQAHHIQVIIIDKTVVECFFTHLAIIGLCRHDLFPVKLTRCGG